MPDTPANPPGLTDLEACQTRGDFGRLLTQLRGAARLSIRDVSAATGIPVATLGDYFNGRHLPPARDRILERIVAACGVTEPTLAAAWAAARDRVRPTPGRPAANAPAPYRGLAFFRTEDAAWFFGRADLTARLASEAARLRAQGLPLVVAGPSGAGKSSLLRAGLIPSLAPGTAVIVFTPGTDPAQALAAALPPTGPGEPAAAPGLAIIVDQFEEVFAPGVADTERDELIERLYALARPGPDGTPGALVVLGLRADFYGRALADPRLARSLQDGQVVVGPMTAEEVRAAIEGPAQAAHLDLEPGLADLMLRDLRPVSARRGAHDPGALPLLSHALLSTWQGRRSGRLTIEGYRASGGITDAVARSADQAYAGLTASQQRAARRLFLRLVWVADDGADTRRRVPLTDLGGTAGDDLSTVLALFVDQRLITSDEHTAEITHEALLTAWPQLRSWIDEGRAELVIARRIAESAQLWRDAGRDDADLLRGGRLAMARSWAAEPETSTPAAASVSAERRATLSATELRFVDASFARYRAEQAEQRRVSRRIRRLAATLAVVLLGTAALAGYAWQQRSDAGQQRNQADSRQDAAEAMNLRSQDPTLAEQLSLAAYRMASTSQARGSLLTSSDTPLAARLLGPSDTVQAVALSPDHGLLAVAAADGTVRLWNVARPDHPVSLGPPFVRQKQAFYAAAFSPDGRVLAVAGAGDQVQLWNVARPSQPVQLGHPLTGPAGTVYALAFSPAGTTLAAGSADGTVRLWTMGAGGAAPGATDRPVALPVTAGDYVQTVAFNPAGTDLAAGTSGGTVARWALPDAKAAGAKGRPTALPTLNGPADVVFSVAFSPDGRTLAAGSKDKTVWLWNVTNPARPRPTGQFKGATSWINAVAFSPDGSLLADGSSDGSAQLWDVATATPVATLPDPGPVTTLAWDSGQHLITGAADGSVRVWALPPAVLATDGLVNGVAFSAAHPDMLAVASGNLQLWDAVRRVPLGPAVTVPGTSPGGAAFSPSGSVLAAGYLDGMLRMYRVTTAGGQSRLVSEGTVQASDTGYVESVAYSPNGRLVATADDDSTVRLWNVSDPAHPRKVATLRGFGSYVFSVAFNRAGTMLAASSADKTVRLWNIADPVHPRQLGPALTGPANTVYSVAFDPAEPVLAAGSADRTVWLWNIADPAHPRRLGRPLTGPASYVYSIAFSPSGTMLAAGSTDDTVWLWGVSNPAKPAPLATLTGPSDRVYTVAFSPTGSTLAAGSADGSVHLWDTTAAAAARAVCSMGGDPIDRSEWARYLPGTPYRPPCR
jgi:WD40 repeat protein/transcriptional regulator with XRE-family HTH domain